MRKRIKNVTVLDSGLLVRKIIKSKLYSCYFGYSKYGDFEQALDQALKYLSRLLQKSIEVGAYQQKNINNCTGFIGVAWHCRICSSRPNSSVHAFRANAIKQSKSYSNAKSATLYGLWGAYKSTVNCRRSMVGQGHPKHEELSIAFNGFIDGYIKRLLNERQPILIKEMQRALIELIFSKDVPEDIVDMVKSKTASLNLVIETVQP